MKRLLLLLSFAYLWQTQAQTVFAPPGTYWNYYSADGDMGMKTLQYSGDTTINTYNCKKIKEWWYFNTVGPNPPDSGNTVNYIYERNDSIFQYFPSINPSFQLLYSFNQTVGDSILFTNGIPYKLVFDSIKQITLCGTQRRVLYYSKSTFSCGMQDSIKVIEGLSYVNDFLFSQIPSCVVADGRMAVSCIKTLDCLYSHYGQACSPLAIKEQLNIKNKALTIYPIPAGDLLFINSNSDEKLIANLYDVNGTHVFSGSINNKSINISALNEGFYTLIIKTVDQIINEKVIILR